MKHTSLSLDFAGKKLTLETGKLAHQATAAVLGRLGDTMVLATVVASKKESMLDYFPLTVEYVERLYAGGRIKGSRWVKREGRPSDDAILTGRLIDRSIRPLFPKEYKNDVQVVVTVLSVDGENEPDVLSLIAVSAALAMSPIPWNGPVGAVRIGYVKEADGKGEFIVNPGGPELQLSELDMVVSQTKEKTVMIEAGALQIAETVGLDAVKKAHEQNTLLIDFINQFVKEAHSAGSRAEKVTVNPNTLLLEYAAKIEKSYKEDVLKLIELRAHNEGGSLTHHEAIVDKMYADEMVGNPGVTVDKKLLSKALEKVFFKTIREHILKKGKRPDGRAIDEVRPISVEVGVLPRTHGSAIFQRGDTQVLSIATLGSARMEQLIESAEGEEKKRYIHHYSFPPYSVGETGRIGFLSRREIGHGALAERALMAVIPNQATFPYTIRVVSEVLSSNGSTSMASTCGSTLALMDAGVPILKPVAGVAMGLVSSEDKYVILTDILGLEDFSGDMDFKITGTDTGMTAIQLDVKIPGLTIEQIAEIFERAKTARLFILEKMLAVIPESRKELSEYAPKINQLKIPVEKIGEVIGPGGRVIKNIIATTGAEVDVEDDGTVNISGVTDEQVQSATQWVQGLTRDVTVGEVFEQCEVKRILPFGAFVEFLPGKEGMVHVSQMSTQFVRDPNDVVKIGQKVTVRVLEIDQQGRINLSMLMEGEAKKDFQRERPSRPYHSAGRIPSGNPAGRTQSGNTAGGSMRSQHPLARQFQRERNQGRKRY